MPVTPSSSTLSPGPPLEAAAADTVLAGLEPCMHALLCAGTGPCVAVRPAGLLLAKDNAFIVTVWLGFCCEDSDGCWSSWSSCCPSAADVHRRPSQRAVLHHGLKVVLPVRCVLLQTELSGRCERRIKS